MCIGGRGLESDSREGAVLCGDLYQPGSKNQGQGKLQRGKKRQARQVKDQVLLHSPLDNWLPELGGD